MVNASNFRKEMFKYMAYATRFSEPVRIVTKVDNYVLMTDAEYRGMMETRYIESVPGLKEAILAGREEKGIQLGNRTLEQFIADECSED